MSSDNAAITELTPIPVKVSDDASKQLPTLPSLVTEHQLQHFKDLGLGRGVNIADPKPWTNRSSFRVRGVTLDDITGSDEGSAYEGYENEVESTFNIHFAMESSFNVPNSPVSIGVDVEQSRTVSTSRRTVGRRVITRTITYKAEKEVSPMNPFEKHVLTWLLQQVRDKLSATDVKAVESLLKIRLEEVKESDLEEVMETLKKHKKEVMKALKKHKKEIKAILQSFIDTFRVTHYVNAIHLGAASYYVYTEEEYHSAVKSKIHMTVPNAGGGSATTNISKHMRSKKSQEKKIGHLQVCPNGDAMVKMGTSDEAVVGIKMLPISTLITIPELQRMVHETSATFFEKSQDYSFGPFYISTNDESLLLNVEQVKRVGKNMTYVVYAIKNPRKNSKPNGEKNSEPNGEEADEDKPALFHVLPTDNPSHPHEFFITHIPNEPQKKAVGSAQEGDKDKPHSTPRYLTAPSNWRGFCQGPLELKLNVRRTNAAFTLVNRVMRSSRAASTAPWISSRDAYFLKCATKPFSRHAYLAVVKQYTHIRDSANKLKLSSSWVLRCMPTKYQEDRDDVSMLFRLLPCTYLQTEASDATTKTKSTEATSIELDASTPEHSTDSQYLPISGTTDAEIEDNY